MKRIVRAGILGAGLGSRLESEGIAKPLVKIAGMTLLDHLLVRFNFAGLGPIHCALRGELIGEIQRSTLPAQEGLSYIFLNSKSSLHTLVGLTQSFGDIEEPILFAMVDTILKKQDLRDFTEFCATLPAASCAVLITNFVEDEKPLWVQLKKNGEVAMFNEESSGFVTSGVYFLSPAALKIAEIAVTQGVEKMRNYLSLLLQTRIAIKTFVVEKTIDVDHPSDLIKAADFLQSD